MKLLKDEVIEKSEGNVKITLNPISTSIQSVLIDYAMSPGVEGKIGYSIYGLKNIISSLEIDGVSFNPVDVANRADLDDRDTIQSMITIGRLLDEACFASAEEKKRLGNSARQSDKESTAENVQDQTKG